jgi:hypothetical protein
VKYLSLALWADRISIRQSTGYSAFEMIYGRDCLLPIELLVESWGMVDWDEVKTRDDLNLARMHQLDQRKITERRAVDTLRNSRKGNKARFDERPRLRPDIQQLNVGDLVLLYDSTLGFSRSRKRKLDDR